MDEDTMDGVFAALANRRRRRMLDVVKAKPGSIVAEVCEHFPELSRIAVMKHLKVLEEAELLLSEREGRQRHLYFNAVPIQMVYDRWSSELSALWAPRLTRLKAQVETQLEGEEEES